MALTQVSVNVEPHINDIMSQLVSVIEALKAGQGVTQIALSEVLKLQSLITDIQAVPADVAESLSGTINAVCINASALAASLLGKK